MTEMNWVLLGKPNPDEHLKILPDYCYNILDVFRKTYFKAFPSKSETITVTSKVGQLLGKNPVEIDWAKVGQLSGILDRCLRFVDQEAAESLEHDGLSNLPPEKTAELLLLLGGPKFVQQNEGQFAGKSFDKIMTEMLETQVAIHAPAAGVSEFKFNALAKLDGVESMVDLNRGKGKGLTGFLDEDGQLAGESPRAGIYIFLMLGWPEIKAMLESNPNKTIRDLHEWLLPFMRAGFVTFTEIETLCDVCEPPPRGIGLSLRPLKARPQ